MVGVVGVVVGVVGVVGWVSVVVGVDFVVSLVLVVLSLELSVGGASVPRAVSTVVSTQLAVTDCSLSAPCSRARRSLGSTVLLKSVTWRRTSSAADSASVQSPLALSFLTCSRLLTISDAVFPGSRPLSFELPQETSASAAAAPRAKTRK